MPTTATSIADPLSLARRMIDEAKAPVTLAALGKRTKMPVADLQALLAGEVSRGAMHRWPDLRRQQRFWNRSAEDVLRTEILEAAGQLAVPAAQLAKEVRKRIPGHPAKLVTSAIQHLIRAKELQRYTGFGREKELLGRAGYPQAYAAAGKAAIRKIEEQIAAAMPAGAGLQGAMLEAMKRMQPSGSAPVSVRELRAVLPEAGKEAFDQAALELRARRQVYLSRHDFPQGLAAEERAQLIDGHDGNYYVAIAARAE